jgi:hypothetical protein
VKRVVTLVILSAACATRPAAPPPAQPMYAYPAPQPAYAPPPPAPPQAAACAAEGGYDCTPDRRALTRCQGGRAVVVSTCRGPRGCTIGQAVDCDHSTAMVGDPCEGPKEIACSSDRKQLLRCNGTYQPGEACRNACLSTQGRVLCQ